MSGYELSRMWFDFSFENPDKCNSTHTALYMWICEKWNRLGQKEKFGLPAEEAMEVLSIKSRSTYYKAFNDLVQWGFIEIVSDSRNQYTSKVIMLVQKTNMQPNGTRTALDSALIQQAPKQEESTVTGTVLIDKPNNKETRKPKTKKQETLPDAAAPVKHKNEFYEVFQEWFTGLATVPFDMGKKDWVGIAEIKKYCDENCNKGFEPLDSFRWILNNYGRLPKFYQDNRNPPFIASRISEIIGLIKSPSNNNGRQDALVDMFQQAKTINHNNTSNDSANLLNLLGQ